MKVVIFFFVASVLSSSPVPSAALLVPVWNWFSRESTGFLQTGSYYLLFFTTYTIDKLKNPPWAEQPRCVCCDLSALSEEVDQHLERERSHYGADLIKV